MRPGSPTFGGYEYQGGYNHAPRGPETTFDYGQRAEAVAEHFAEDMITGLRPLRIELPLFQYLALASVAFGVENRYEIILATGAHVVWKFTGNDGLAAIYSTLAGIQIQKKKFKTAAFATLLDVYDTFNDYMNNRGITKKGIQKLVWWATGYTAAMLKYV